ncbi:hypothetical protein GMJAKD_17410 [Candidatus Electrothrix aarhusensis]
MKKICLLTTGIVALFLVVGSTNAFAGPSGIIAQGEFSVYKKGKLADKMSGITPVTEDTLLVCESNCLIKTKGIAIIVQDGTEMAVKNSQDQFNLMVMNGLVDFSLTDQAGKIAFYTADGQYSVGDAMFNASTKDAIRGYMQIADDGRARVGLHDGRMVFSTGEGPKTVNSNEYILLKAESKITPSTIGVTATSLGPAAPAAAGWFGFSTTATVFTTCAVVSIATVTTVSISKESSGPNPYKGSSKEKKGSTKSSSSGATVTKKTTTTTITGKTTTTGKTITTTQGPIKVTNPLPPRITPSLPPKGSKGTILSWPPKGSKGVIRPRPPKGSKGIILPRPPGGSIGIIQPRPWLPPPILGPCPTCPRPVVVRPPCSTCPPPCCPNPSPSR